MALLINRVTVEPNITYAFVVDGFQTESALTQGDRRLCVVQIECFPERSQEAGRHDVLVHKLDKLRWTLFAAPDFDETP